MKTYSKRLLIIFLCILLVVLVSSVFIAPIFTLSASDLNIHPGSQSASAESAGRSESSQLPGAKEIDAQGYDTKLPAGYAPVLEDQKSAVYFQKETAEVAIQDKSTGQVWLSNPENLDSETMVEGTTKKRIGAQLTVSYLDAKGNIGQMDSSNDCIAYGNMTYQVKDNCLSVNYRLGKTVITSADVPQQMSKARFEEFTKSLSVTDRNYLLAQYGLASVKNAEASFKKIMVQKYPNIEKTDIYFLKYDSTRILTQVKAIWDKCGYSSDDLSYDNKENKVVTEVTVRPYFVVCLEYRLVDGALQVTMDSGKLQYEKQIPPYTISLLEYFGAGGKNDKGYMLLPDGSGTLIYYNNGKTKASAFSMPIYGKNTVTDTEADYLADNKLSLPVFGIKRGAAALLVTVDSGASLCSLNARVAGLSNSYNTVYPSFLATDYDVSQLSEDSKQIYTEQQPYRGKVVITYHPLDPDHASYIGMAQAYRSMLLENGTLKKNTVSDSYPLLADYICGVPSKTLFLGVPVKSLKAATTFSQVRDITAMLKSEGVNGLSVRLEGWMNGGLAQKYVGSLQIEGALGGAAGLAELNAYLKKNGIAFYPDVFISTVFDKGNGFNVPEQNIRNLCRDIAVRYFYDYMNRYRTYDGRVIYQLSPTFLGKASNAFIKGYAQTGIAGFSLPDFASLLYSDYRVGRACNREDSLSKTTDSLERLAGSGEIAESNPNLYGLTYGSYVYDLPTEDSHFRLCDESVPFYQTVLRGLVDYVSPSLNYASDYETALLEAVEFGSGLQYTLTGENTAVLKDTQYNYINKGHYSDWSEIVAKDYAKAASIMKPLQGVEIVGHERISENFYRTDYADGTSVYVNYTDKTQSENGVSVDARGFAAAKGGK